MSLPARGRLQFRCDSGWYQYVFTPDQEANRGRLVIELKYGEKRPVLLIHWLGLLPDKPKIIPRRHIRDVINFALSQGWESNDGNVFEIACDARSESLAFYVRPLGTSNDWFLSNDNPT